jgi:hypothetical protein
LPASIGCAAQALEYGVDASATVHIIDEDRSWTDRIQAAVPVTATIRWER